MSGHICSTRLSVEKTKGSKKNKKGKKGKSFAFFALFVFFVSFVSRFQTTVFELCPDISSETHFSKISLKKSTARGSPVWPSQNIACLRTAGLEWVLAILISNGTDSSFDL